MKVSVALLGFALVAGMVSLASAGGPYFPYEGCLTSLGWLQYEDYCYKYVSPPGGDRPAPDYQDICEREGPYKGGSPITYLADIRSQAENDFIQETVTSGNRAWVGALREGSSWFWVKDIMTIGNREPIAYTNWKPNEPNNRLGEENCMEINRGPPGRWNDLPCQKKLPGICKYSISEWSAP